MNLFILWDLQSRHRKRSNNSDTPTPKRRCVGSNAVNKNGTYRETLQNAN